MRKKTENYYANERQEMLELIPKGYRVKSAVDIGCGKGYFAQALKKKTDAEVWGVEIDKISAKEASKRIDKIINSSVEDALSELPDGYFDVIYCNDVLEHLYDPETVVKKLRKKLTKEGLLISSIPNVRYFHTFIALLRGREWEYTHDGVLDFTHLRFFTDKSILNMFQRAGYSLILQKGINPTIIPPKFKILNKLIGGKFDDMQYIQFATVVRK